MNKALFSYYRQRIFYSLTHPLFYLSALVFALFCSGSFFLTGKFFTGLSGTSLNNYFNAIPYISILIIPLLCLDPFSSYEKSLPFSKFSLEIVKILSVLTEFCIILLPSSFVPICINLFGFVEGAEVFTGFIFIILYAFTSISLCFFMKSLFENTFIAILLSVVFSSIFNFIHIFVKTFSSSALISKILKDLSFSWHFDSAQKGIFDSRDFVFFIIAGIFFLLFNVYFYEIKLSRHFSKKQKSEIFWIISILLLCLLNSSRYYFRKDFTRLKNYSLTEYSKNILKENTQNLNITYYVNRELETLYPTVKDINEILNEYAENKNVSFSVQDPVQKNEVQNLLNYEIYPRQIQQSSKGKTEVMNVYSAIVLEMNGKIQVIPFIMTAKNLEFLVTEKILKLSETKERYVNILSGSGENIDEKYSYLIQFLSYQGFTVNRIDNNSNIADQIEKAGQYGSLLLVLGSSALTDREVQAIESYLEKENKVFFAVSPYEKDIEGSWYITKSNNQKLIRLLENYGIKFSKNIIKDISSARILMQDDNNNSTYINYPLWPALLPQENAKNGMTLFWPVKLELYSENARPLLKSSSYSFEISPDEKSKENLFQTNPFLLQEEGYPAEDKKSSFVLALSYQGEAYGYYNPGIFENIRFDLVSDQYFLNSLMLGYIGGEYGDYRNLDFLTAELFKLNDEKGLAALYEKGLENQNTFYKTPDEDSFARARFITLFVNFILTPVLFLLLYLILFIVRKNKK